MFCPSCGEQIASGDAFCRHCGVTIGAAPSRPTGAKPAVKRQSTAARFFTIVPLFLVLVAALYWGHFEPEMRKDAARKAIRNAVEACGVGKLEFDHRYVEAEAAISELATFDRENFEAGLNNQLRLVLCPYVLYYEPSGTPKKDKAPRPHFGLRKWARARKVFVAFPEFLGDEKAIQKWRNELEHHTCLHVVETREEADFKLVFGDATHYTLADKEGNPMWNDEMGPRQEMGAGQYDMLNTSAGCSR